MASQIEQDALRAVHAASGWFHHDKETEVTTTAPQQPNVLADLSYALSQLGGNGLIARLFRDGLGRNVSDSEIEHVVAIVAAFEKQPVTGGTMAPAPLVFPAPGQATATTTATGA
jgi:hypothetical protein